MEISASTTTPVSIISLSIVSRSIAINAPVLVAEKSSIALTRESTVSTALFLSILRNEFVFMRFLRPTCSSALRSSGWNNTTTAKSPMVNRLLSSQFSRYRLNMSDTKNATMIITSPRMSCIALVSLIKPIIL